jgi:hypothetical protein
VAEAVGKGWRGDGNGGRETAAPKLWARARWQPPLFEGSRRGLGAAVRTGSPTGGSHVVFNFSNLPKLAQV